MSKKGSGKVLAVILLIIVIILAAYFIFSGPSNPLNVYNDYRKEFVNINSFEEYATLGEKYGTANYIKETASYRDALTVIPGDMSNMILGLQKSLFPSPDEMKSIQILSQSNDGATASYSMQTADGKKIGDIILVNVDGDWKIESDKWRKGATA